MYNCKKKLVISKEQKNSINIYSVHATEKKQFLAKIESKNILKKQSWQ
jgi:hypothetical protein